MAMALAVPGSVSLAGEARAADPGAAAPRLTGADCTAKDAPYKDYKCLDAYLGEDVVTRLYRYYVLELGHEGPPADPNAAPARRAGWPEAPESTPPMPFTEWPYGGSDLRSA